LFHANLLKKYHEREEPQAPQATTEITGAAILEPDEKNEDTISVQLLSDAKETWKDVKVNDKLSSEQTVTVKKVALRIS